MLSKPRRTILMALGSYDSRTHEGIASAARDFGWFLDISLMKTLEIPSRWSGDGILASLNRNRRLENLVRQSKIPIVDLSVWRSDLRMPRVVADNHEIGRLAARHFLENGHTSFGWFARRMNPVWEERLEGYRGELGPKPIAVAGLKQPDAGIAEEGGDWMRQLSRPTAFFCPSDEEAANLLAICIRMEIRVPDEIAILGVDNNSLICENQPTTLSSINHDLFRVGYEGARLLERLMCGETVAEESVVRISPEGLTVRESTDALAVKDPVVRKALESMRAEPGVRIGVAELAGRLGIGRRDLERRFRVSIGQTPHQRWRELRLAAARRQVESGQESMEDIAATCGFSNGPHFSNRFRERFGCTPLEWRRGKRPGS